MTNYIKPAKLKKDYITGIAILFFVILLLVELFSATFLIKKLTKEELWEKEMSYTEIAELTDRLREKLKSNSFVDKDAKEEALLLTESVDIIAEFLKKNSSVITRQQIRDIRNDLDAFDEIAVVWRNQKKYKYKEKLDLSKYIDELKLKK